MIIVLRDSGSQRRRADACGPDGWEVSYANKFLGYFADQRDQIKSIGQILFFTKNLKHNWIQIPIHFSQPKPSGITL